MCESRGFFCLITVIPWWANPWEKVKGGSLRWHWDEWELFLVVGVTGGCTGAVVMGVSAEGEMQWGRGAGSNTTHWEEALCCQGSHRGPTHHRREETHEGRVGRGLHVPWGARALVPSQRPFWRHVHGNINYLLSCVLAPAVQKMNDLQSQSCKA